MIKINPKDLFVSIVDQENAKELLAYDLRYNFEIARFHKWENLDRWKSEADQFLKFIQEKNIDCSLHGPFDGLPYHSSDPIIQEVARFRFNQILDVAEKLKPKYVVLHSTFNPNVVQKTYPKRWVERTVKFFKPIIMKAQQRGTIILIENIFDPDPEPINEVVKELNSPHCKICIDIGHWALFSKRSIKEWIDVFGENLAYFHLHDNGGEFDDHAALGTGKINFADLFSALEKSPASPKYCLEVRSIEAIERSLQFLRQNQYIAE